MARHKSARNLIPSERITSDKHKSLWFDDTYRPRLGQLSSKALQFQVSFFSNAAASRIVPVKSIAFGRPASTEISPRARARRRSREEDKLLVHNGEQEQDLCRARAGDSQPDVWSPPLPRVLAAGLGGPGTMVRATAALLRRGAELRVGTGCAGDGGPPPARSRVGARGRTPRRRVRMNDERGRE